ncbi:glycosyltransferase [Caldicellulosiruptoraceae bacterium PP1]
MNNQISKREIDLPNLNFEHLFRMTDSTGILQHAKFSIPDYNHGYTTDDNARALIIVIYQYENTHERKFLELIYRYASFINYAKTKNGFFKNFMNYSKVFIDENGTEDCFSRTLIALSYLYISSIEDKGIKEWAYITLKHALRNVLTLKHPISIAYAIVALSNIHDEKEFSKEAKIYLEALSEKLIIFYEKHCNKKWKWFSDKMTYANAILPYSLLRSFAVTEKERYNKVAIEALDFLTDVLFKDKILRLIGNRGWYQKGKERSFFDEQPIDACDCVIAYSEAYRITDKAKYKEKAIQSFKWFLGENIVKEPLYNSNSGGCKDGIEIDGLNMNEGAESLISFLISRIVIEDVIYSFSKNKEAV